MSHWSKDAALEELGRLISEIGNLRSEYSYCAAHTRWLLGTSAFLKEVFGEASAYHLNMAHLRWRYQGQMIVPVDEALAPWAIEQRYDRMVYLRSLDTAEGVLESA
jgi:hypothetical protein